MCIWKSPAVMGPSQLVLNKASVLIPPKNTEAEDLKCRGTLGLMSGATSHRLRKSMGEAPNSRASCPLRLAVLRQDPVPGALCTSPAGLLPACNSGCGLRAASFARCLPAYQSGHPESWDLALPCGCMIPTLRTGPGGVRRKCRRKEMR